ncbi:MAG: YjjG family noncanonical pyrimidine nucleotidase [Bacteroidota bacterium]
MYKVILADADDTIFDFGKSERHALERTFQDLHKSADMDALFTRYHAINKQLWADLELGLIDNKTLRVERFRRLFDEFGLSLPPKEFGDLYLQHLGEGAYLLDGAEELCKYLSEKYTLVIVTNGIKEVQRSRLGRSTIQQYVSGLIISEEVGVSKPHPHIFDAALRTANHSERHNVLMIGDSLNSDILGGINYGIDTCWVNPDGLPNTLSTEPTYQIRTIGELYNFL